MAKLMLSLLGFLKSVASSDPFSGSEERAVFHEYCRSSIDLIVSTAVRISCGSSPIPDCQVIPPERTYPLLSSMLYCKGHKESVQYTYTRFVSHLCCKYQDVSISCTALYPNPASTPTGLLNSNLTVTLTYRA